MSPDSTASRSHKKGMMPESLVYVGEHRDAPVHVRVLDYNHSEVRELLIDEISQCAAFTSTESVSWIDVDGIHDGRVVESLGKIFGIHALVLEDIMNSQSRPKVEFFEDYTFITMKMLELTGQAKAINSEQLSLVIGDKFMLMFQERPGDGFDSIRERVRTAKGKVRAKDAYYLAYLLLDTVVDNYIHVSEELAAQIDAMEAQVLRRPTEITLHRILRLRKELLDFKRSIDPLKEAINTMTRELNSDIAKYYRDLYDHIIYESENLAVYREMLANLLDLYHSSINTRTNQVMKVLTIVTTIFVPLTFLVGIYGMNFDVMPELHWSYGYPALMALMLLIVVVMVFYFKKKKWL